MISHDEIFNGYFYSRVHKVVIAFCIKFDRRVKDIVVFGRLLAAVHVILAISSLRHSDGSYREASVVMKKRDTIWT